MDKQFHDDYERLKVLSKEAYGVMAHAVSRYHYFESLVLVKHILSQLRKDKKSFVIVEGQPIGFHVFPFIIDIIIKHASFLPSEQKIGHNILAWLNSRYVHYPDMLQLETGKREINKYVPEWLIKSSFEQLTIQEMNVTLIPRILFLYEEIPKKNRNKFIAFISVRDEVLRNQFRVNLDDFLLCAFSLGAIAATADRFEEKIKTEIDWMKPYIESDAFHLVRSQLSITREEYKKRADLSFSGNFVNIKTEPLIFYDYPILKEDNYYIAPDPHMILTRVTRGLHDSIYQYFIDNGRIQDYASTFGEVFKEYVGLLLKEIFQPENVYDLDSIESEGKKADWLAIHENYAFIFECKAQKYPKEMKQTGSLDILTSFIEKKIKPAIDQIENSAKNMKSDFNIKQEFNKINTIKKYLVFEEHFQFANSLKDFLPEDKTLDYIEKKEIEILSLLDLETIVYSNYIHDIKNVFLKKFQSQEQNVRKLPGFSFTEDNILKKKFDAFFHRSDF